MVSRTERIGKTTSSRMENRNRMVRVLELHDGDGVEVEVEGGGVVLEIVEEKGNFQCPERNTFFNQLVCLLDITVLNYDCSLIDITDIYGIFLLLIKMGFQILEDF